jgi:alpha-ketoglutarate-dependent taurine dioxygenase
MKRGAARATNGMQTMALGRKEDAAMLLSVTVDPTRMRDAAERILSAWRNATVVHVRAPGLESEQVRAFYDALLPMIGTPHHLAEDVRAGDREQQRTGELWFEVRFDPNVANAYRHSANAQPLHTDGSYIPTFPNATLMCCVRNAAEGGETTFIAAQALVDALHEEDPALLRALETLPVRHERSGDHREHPVIRRENGVLRLNWNYYCVSPHCSPEVLAMRERFFQFLQSSPAISRALMPVKLEAGEAVAWQDELLLHGRNAFRATQQSERFLWKCAVDIGVFAESARELRQG